MSDSDYYEWRTDSSRSSSPRRRSSPRSRWEHRERLEEQLLDAARCGDESAVREALNEGAFASCRDSMDLTPLHLAAYYGHTDVARILLARGAAEFIDIQDRDGERPLHAAVKRSSNYDIVELLLERGARVNGTRGSSGHSQTPLHMAVELNHVDIVRLLLEHGADKEARDDNRQTPVDLARASSSSSAMRALLMGGKTDQEALLAAASRGDVAVVRAMAGALAPGDATLECRDKDGDTPLICAVYFGHVKVAQLLLELGACINSRRTSGSTPLHVAASQNHGSVLKLLLESAGADVDAKKHDGKTPLHVAAECGHIEIAWRLLKRGADVSAKSETGRTPLHWAAESDHLKVARLLLEYGADADAENNGGKVPLHYARTRSMWDLLHSAMQDSESDSDDEDAAERVAAAEQQAAAACKAAAEEKKARKAAEKHAAELQRELAAARKAAAEAAARRGQTAPDSAARNELESLQREEIDRLVLAIGALSTAEEKRTAARKLRKRFHPDSASDVTRLLPGRADFYVRLSQYANEKTECFL